MTWLLLMMQMYAATSSGDQSVYALATEGIVAMGLLCWTGAAVLMQQGCLLGLAASICVTREEVLHQPEFSTLLAAEEWEFVW